MNLSIIISHVADSIERSGEPLSENQRAALAGSLGLCLWKIEMTDLESLIRVLEDEGKE